MAELPPVVYLLIGEDEFTMAEFIAHHMIEKMGDRTIAEVNITRLDGRVNTLEELENATRAMPFLVSRRLVIFEHPLERVKTPDQQRRLKHILEKAPHTTSIVLVIDHFLTSKKERQENKIHWLERWAQEQKERVWMRFFYLPEGANLAKWIQQRVKSLNGEITDKAADLLTELVGSEPRFLDQEIAKLLAYVNYARPINESDVEKLTPSVARVGDFALVNALREGDRCRMLSLLRKELLEKDELMILGSIVMQYRVILLAREILDQGGRREDVIRQLASFKVSEYPAGLAADLASQFHMEALEKIYHRLLELDEAIKTSNMEGTLALDLLVTELTS